MGGVCDRWGPRYGSAALLLLTASATFGEALARRARPACLPQRGARPRLPRARWASGGAEPSGIPGPIRCTELQRPLPVRPPLGCRHGGG